jgi:hypothetical protein
MQRERPTILLEWVGSQKNSNGFFSADGDTGGPPVSVQIYFYATYLHSCIMHNIMHYYRHMMQ